MYIGISTGKFDQLVHDGRMPPPIFLDGRKLWDLRKLDFASMPLIMIHRMNLGRISDGISGAKMTTFKLPYVHEFRDRHGKLRRYVRRRGVPRVVLPGLPGSPEFMQAYNDSLEGRAALPPSRYGSGTIGALWTEYRRSASYANLSDSSKRTYGQIISPVLEQHGHRSVVGMNRQHARKIVEAVGLEAPAMANLTIAVIRLLFSFAVENGWRSDNPCRGIRKYKGGEHESWTDEDLLIFEKRWPVGTRERLVYDLLLYTAQRGGDVVNWKHSDCTTGAIILSQQKTGTKLVIPIHAALKRSIKACAGKGLHILADAYGKPIQRRTLTRIIRLAVKEAALPARCVAHGLRKTAMRRLAENGATEKEMAAVSGHKSISEVQRYTKSADQAGLARAAMKRIPNR
jgi:integrase